MTTVRLNLFSPQPDIDRQSAAAHDSIILLLINQCRGGSTESSYDSEYQDHCGDRQHAESDGIGETSQGWGNFPYCAKLMFSFHLMIGNSREEVEEPWVLLSPLSATSLVSASSNLFSVVSCSPKHRPLGIG